MASICLLIFSLIPGSVTGNSDADQNGFYRFPTIRGDLVVFNSEGDLWLTTLGSSSEAIRLSRHSGYETYSRISPDGRWIAFTGEYDGNRDVYLSPVSGGEPVRLTFHPEWDEVVGWSKDSQHIFFRSHRNSPFYIWKIFSVSIEGGYPRDYGLDKVSRLSEEPGGDRVAYTRLRRENTSWKRYKGGQAMDIWIGNLKTNEYGKLTEFDGTDAFPMWIGERIYFLSDRSGRSNLFSMKPDGKDVRQLTFEEKWDIRWPSTDGKKIVYQKAMDIYTYDIASGRSEMIDIILPSDRIRVRKRIINPAGYIDSYSIPNEARRIAVAARGEVFTFPVEKKGYIRQITNTPAGRDRVAVFSPDGKQIAIISDVTGEDEIWLYASDGKEKPRQLTKRGDRKLYWLNWSPDGTKIVYSDKSNRLFWIDVKSGKKMMIDEAPGLGHYEWSPDSRWIAWTRTEDDYTSDIYLVNIDSGQRKRITTPMTGEYNPTWDPDGKYLYFLSQRWFNPVLGGEGSYISDKSALIYAVMLSKETLNPFAPKLIEAFEDKKEDDEKEKKDKDGDKDDKDKDDEDEAVAETIIDLDGIENRIYPLPVNAGNYFGLSAVSGKVYFGSWENYGMNYEGDRPDGFPLHIFNMDEQEEETVGGGRINNFAFSPDRSKMLITKNGSFRIMEAGATTIPEEDGLINMGGWSMEIDPSAEWTQILREVWRLERDFFYDPDLHGVDWKQVWEQYSQLLPRISTREEMNDLIREMLGELNVGHAYTGGGDTREARQIGIGSLGIDLDLTKKGHYRITKILHGDAWGDEPVSPLAAAPGKAQVGDYIVAINNIPIMPGENINSRMVNQGGKDVLLSLNSKPQTKDAREVVVRALGNEDFLRYLDWVRDRREYVDSLSNGTIGYIHLPDMGGQGLSMWMRQYYQQIQKKGLIIDVRYNRGGFVANMILSTLGQKVWARGISREGLPSNRPWSAFNGPKAAICNHETSSDGETFSEAFKRLELGKLFGTRTWGGWVGIHGWQPLNDRGFNTVPQSTAWGVDDGKWLIEGPGVMPDYEIVDDPLRMLRGEDPQLDAAVEHVLKEIKEWKQPAAQPAYPTKKLNIQHYR